MMVLIAFALVGATIGSVGSHYAGLDLGFAILATIGVSTVSAAFGAVLLYLRET